MNSHHPFPRRVLTAALATFALGAFDAPLAAQSDDIPESVRARTLPRQHLSGPRFGFTAFTGDVARLRADAGKSPLMSQFGWQFETQIVSTTRGEQALMEWVVLVGGLEQDEFNIGLAWLAGYRTVGGIEFGVGPHLGLSKDSDEPSTSVVVAGGATLPFGELYVPANVAVAFARGGPRITTLLGWIVG